MMTNSMLIYRYLYNVDFGIPVASTTSLIVAPVTLNSIAFLISSFLAAPLRFFKCSKAS